MIVWVNVLGSNLSQIWVSWAVWASIWPYNTKNRLNPLQKLDSDCFKMSFWYFNTYPSTRSFNVKRWCWRWALENVTDDTNTNEHVYALRLSEMVVCKWNSYIPSQHSVHKYVLVFGTLQRLIACEFHGSDWTSDKQISRTFQGFFKHKLQFSRTKIYLINRHSFTKPHPFDHPIAA